MNRTKLINIAIACVLIIVSVVLLIFGIKNVNKTKSYNKTTAVITQIESDYDVAIEQYDYTVYVKYTIDGIEYENVLGSYLQGYKEGKEVEIYYSPTNPNDILAASPFTIYMSFVIAGVAFVAGIILMVRAFIKKQDVITQ